MVYGNIADTNGCLILLLSQNVTYSIYNTSANLFIQTIELVKKYFFVSILFFSAKLILDNKTIKTTYRVSKKKWYLGFYQP